MDKKDRIKKLQTKIKSIEATIDEFHPEYDLVMESAEKATKIMFRMKNALKELKRELVLLENSKNKPKRSRRTYAWKKKIGRIKKGSQTP